MDKELVIAFLGLTAIIIIVIGGIWWGVKSYRSWQEEVDYLEYQCEKGDEDACLELWKIGRNRCEIDCKNLEKDYLKQEIRTFSSNECWCVKDNESVQIW